MPSRLPFPISLIILLIIYETFKRENFITTSSYGARRFLLLKYFNRHNKVIGLIFIETIFVASCKTEGAKPKTGGANYGCAICTPCSNVEPPLLTEGWPG